MLIAIDCWRLSVYSHRRANNHLYLGSISLLCTHCAQTAEDYGIVSEKGEKMAPNVELTLELRD